MRKAALLVAVAALLAACDTMPNLRLYNGTGRALDLGIAKGERPFKTFHLQPDEATRIWNIYGPALRLHADGCDRRYDLPFMDVNYPWRLADGQPDYGETYPVEVRLEPDFTLSLLSRPPKKVAGSASARASGVQAHSFPLRPISKTCG